MPKRVIDGEAMWGSTKLSECPEWAIPEYAWLYPLADANGSFELTNLRVIWGKVAAIRPNFTLETLADAIRVLNEHGLLFIWDVDGKRYAHWTGSDRPGRLPRRSWRKRMKALAPAVPQDQLTNYLNANARSRHKREGLTLGLGMGLDRVGDRVTEGAPQNGAPTAQAAAQPSPCAFSGFHLRISERQHRLLAEAFPWVNAQVEYRKADSWLEANPNRRPKSTNRFLQNWFAKIPCPSDGKGGSRAEERTRRNLAAAGFPSE